MGNCDSCLSACCRRKGDDDDEQYEPLLQDNEREAVADLLRFLERTPCVDTAAGDDVGRHQHQHEDDGALLGQRMDEGALRALTTLSYSANVDLQRSAALAFAEVTEGSRTGEVEAAVLDPLLFLVRESGDVEVQRASSAALGNLATHAANKLKIVRLGGIDPLVRLMASNNIEVQCNAVGCLTNLATHDENKAAIARSRALLPLVRIARTTRDVRVQRNATGALLNMTHSEHNRRDLVDAGAIAVFVLLLKSADPDVVYYCTTALSNLAVDAAHRKRLMLETRLVAELVDLTAASLAKIQCQAVLALRNLASDEHYQLEIASNAKGLQRLLQFLIASLPHGTSSVVSTASSATISTPSASTYFPSAQLTLAAVACLRNISIHPANEEKLLDLGILFPLLALLESPLFDEEIRCHCVSTIRNLAAGASQDDDAQPSSATPATSAAPVTKEETKKKILESGTVEILIRLIEQRHGGWTVMSEMTACIAVLALNDWVKPRLLACQSVRILVDLTHPDVPPEVQGNAAAALGNLATNVPDVSPFLEAWSSICGYLTRFLDPIAPTSESSTYYTEEDAVGTFQHIAVWTLLQFSERSGESQMVKLLENVHRINQDAEVVQLARRVLVSIGVSK